MGKTIKLTKTQALSLIPDTAEVHTFKTLPCGVVKGRINKSEEIDNIIKNAIEIQISKGKEIEMNHGIAVLYQEEPKEIIYIETDPYKLQSFLIQKGYYN